jgi:hypothetical protein
VRLLDVLPVLVDEQTSIPADHAVVADTAVERSLAAQVIHELLRGVLEHMSFGKVSASHAIDRVLTLQQHTAEALHLSHGSRSVLLPSWPAVGL